MGQGKTEEIAQGAKENGQVKLLSADEILAADDSGHEYVHVPEWGGTVKVKALTGAERDRYEAQVLEEKKNGRLRFKSENARAKLMAMAVVDEAGKPLFKQLHIEQLGMKSAAALQRVFDVASRLAGLTDEDIEELESGLEPAPSGKSTSA